ncbi:type VI secretion system protein ImpE [Chitinivorax tropicus]|uniref:Type VI secretion system protein ImpE n=1 Tax=Chitinivorax tropicus TaxID=714531 RepID=A0A840MUZ2_9PROT|nr:type VI secretion system accessory protein TagJ [Chitinivorax tropicus]MBB5020143.1 type VI secretion system protein ImpE [Chitinivorax tropicus]
MSAIEALRAGRLQEALELLQQEVRQHPADGKRRVFLFQLLCVMGQWDRANTQLNVVADLDKQAMPMVQTYREVLRCEVLRGEVFAGKRSPLVLGDPPAWLGLLIEALRLLGEGKADEARRLREQAFEAAPAIAGTIDDVPFSWIADADSRLGPVLEFIANGRYYWLPWERVQRLSMEAPTDLRDKIWMPAEVGLANGGELFGFIPTRYAETCETDDDVLKLAGRTDWVALGAEAARGLGQRMLTTDADDYPLLDVRQVLLTPPAQQGAVADQ